MGRLLAALEAGLRASRAARTEEGSRATHAVHSAFSSSLGRILTSLAVIALSHTVKSPLAIGTLRREAGSWAGCFGVVSLGFSPGLSLAASDLRTTNSGHRRSPPSGVRPKRPPGTFRSSTGRRGP